MAAKARTHKLAGSRRDLEHTRKIRTGAHQLEASAGGAHVLGKEKKEVHATRAGCTLSHGVVQTHGTVNVNKPI